MFVNCEYIVVCIGNIFSGFETKVDNELDCLIEELTLYLEKNCSHELHSHITREELQQACLDPKVFCSIIHRLVKQRQPTDFANNHWLDWATLLIIFGFFAQTVKCSLVLTHGCYEHLVELNKILKKFEVNKWIQNQPGQWDGLLEYLLAIKYKES